MAQIYAFLHLEGIDGESKDAAYTDKIELLSANWGSSNNSSFAYGTGSGVGQGETHDIQCSKYMDKSSLLLHKYCTMGKVIPSGKLTLLKQNGDEKIAYFESNLTDIVVKHWTMSAGNSGELPHESFALHFVKHESSYKPQSNPGDAAGNVDFSWDIQQNQS